MLNTRPDFSNRKMWRQMNAMSFLLFAGLTIASLCSANANEVITKPPMPEIQPVQVPLKIEPARKVMELDLAKPAKPETPPPAQAAPGPEPVVAPAVPEITKQAKPGKQQDAPSSQAPQITPNIAAPESTEARNDERLVAERARVKEVLQEADQIKMELQFKPGDTELNIPSLKKNPLMSDMLFGADMVDKQDNQTLTPVLNVNHKQAVKPVDADAKREKAKPTPLPVARQKGREQNSLEASEADESREWQTNYDIRIPPME
jgi:hypothetical protein